MTYTSRVDTPFTPPAIDPDAAIAELTATPRKNLVKVRYTHDACIDILIANPWVSQGQLAAMFGYSQSWISTVMATDMFKARLASRREELVDPAILATIEERFKAIVTKSQQVLLEKLSAPQVPDNLALRAMELGAKSLGIGGHAAPIPIQVAPDHLNNLAARLIELQSKVRQGAGGVVDVESRIVEDDKVAR